jgi:fructose 1,6-bisphosphatase
LAVAAISLRRLLLSEPFEERKNSSMPNMDEINERLSEFKGSGLIADYEVLVADDSVRLRIVAPKGQDTAKLKSFLVETFAGILSETQVVVEPPAE